MADDISPLAQRLAEAYNVDLSKLREKQLEGKITARSVLDYLNAADDNTLEKTVSGSLAEKELNQENPEQKELEEDLEQKDPEQKEPEREEPVQPPPSTSTQGSSAEAVADTVALAKARAQLQVTAKVHQQALMQVGSLREQNTLLEAELELLREAEAQARLQLEAFQKRDEPLEVEVEPVRRWRAFAWLRKLFS